MEEARVRRGRRQREAPERHLPVLCKYVVTSLALDPGLVFVDCTLGSAGHFSAVASALSPGGVAVGIDRDERALDRARSVLSEMELTGVVIHLVHADFGELRRVAARLKLEGVDRVLMDLGVSSEQIDDPKRGFSFLHDGPLDMRQDLRQELTAAEVVNTYPRQELERIIREYGEERYAGRIAEAIDRQRRRGPIEATLELAALIAAAVPAGKGRIHPATRTFQALRIEVGRELESLRSGLAAAAELLTIGGRLAVITFHGLEEREVKQALRPYGRHGDRTDWHLLQVGSLIKPDQDEVRGNPRSRSAKLRVFEKVRIEKGFRDRAVEG